MTREQALRRLAQEQDLRILRRVSPLAELPLAQPRGLITRLAVIDTETTGFDPMRDEIIDLAVALIDVDDAGEIVGLGRRGSALRDPGFPIPPRITKLTGLRDEDVAGQSIDAAKVGALLDEADALLAHNASFDAGFLEALLPEQAGRPWICSARDLDWASHGFDGAKLGHLLNQIGLFNGGHRAMVDVISLVHLLAHRLADGRTVIGHLLERARRPSWRIEATSAPFEHRGLLKSRGYHWDSSSRVWWIEVAEDEREAEIGWLRAKVVFGRQPQTQAIDWTQRHR